MVNRRLKVVIALVGALALAACQGSRDADDTAAPPVPPATSAPATDTPGPSEPPVAPSAPPSVRPSSSASRRPPTSRPPAAPTTKPTTAAPGPGYPYGARTSTGTSGVALTFDDGPTWTGTEAVLAVLRENNVKATFCVLGKMARTYPQRIRQIAQDGHTLCNHTDDHNVKLGTLTEAEIRANLQTTNDAIHAAVPGARISYFRHPGGAWTPAAVKVATEMGMTSLHWDVDPADYNKPGAQVVADRVIARVTPGSIVLLHDGGGGGVSTADACRLMLPTLKDRFQLIPLPTRPAP